MSATEYATILREIKALKRHIDRITAKRELWQTARETGKSKSQLAYIRKTQPDKVKPARKGSRSYLYNLNK